MIPVSEKNLPLRFAADQHSHHALATDPEILEFDVTAIQEPNPCRPPQWLCMPVSMPRDTCTSWLWLEAVKIVCRLFRSMQISLSVSMLRARLSVLLLSVHYLKHFDAPPGHRLWGTGGNLESEQWQQRSEPTLRWIYEYVSPLRMMSVIHIQENTQIVRWIGVPQAVFVSVSIGLRPEL